MEGKSIPGLFQAPAWIWPHKGRLFPYPSGTRVGLTLKEMLGEFTLRDKHTRSISNASILRRWSQLSCWRASCKRLQKAGLESAASTQRGEAAHNFQSFHHHLSHLFKMSDELLALPVSWAQRGKAAHLLGCLPGSPMLCSGIALVN